MAPRFTLVSDRLPAIAAASGLEGLRGVLVDLDGTLVTAAGPLPGASDFVAAWADRMIVLSNNSTDTPRTLAPRLARWGLRIPAERLQLAGAVAVETLARRRPGASIAVFGSAELVRYARLQGLVLHSHRNPEPPEIVLLGRATRFGYSALTRAANWIRRGAGFYATNPDLVHPGPEGMVVPETGALLAAVTAAAGRCADEIFGKPATAFVREGLDRLGCAAGDAALIGDNPDTDGAGAAAVGTAFMLVGGGDLARLAVRR